MDNPSALRLGKPVDNRLAFKSGVLYLIAEFFTRGISFLITPIFTRLLPTAVFADVKIYESWVYLFAPIVSVSLYQSMSRAKFDYKDHYDAFLSSTLALIAVISLGVFGVSWFAIRVLERLLGFSGPLLLLMLLYSLAYNGIQCIQLYARQLMHYKSNIALTMLAVIPAVLISVLFVLKYSGTVTDERLLFIRIVSFFLPTTLIGFTAMAIAFGRGRSFVNLDHWRYGIKYSMPMMAAAIASPILFQSANLIVRKFIGVEAAAIVALAMTVGYIMDILIHAVDNAWRPWLFEQLNAGNFHEVQKFWKFLFRGVSLMVWCLIMLAPELVLFLGGSDYKDSVWLISPMLCGSLANFLMIEYTAVEQFYKKTRISGYASILSAALALILSFVFILAFGYQAAAYTTAASYMIACIVHYLFVRRFETQNVLKTGISILTILVTFAVGMLSTMLFGVTLWVRCLVVVAVLAGITIAGMKQARAILQLVIRSKRNMEKSEQDVL